jgi:ribose/xylose/arabinose/galactoside ABC-type transport system permease subunit
MIVLQGFRFAITNGAPSGNVPPAFKVIATELFLGVPINLIILLVLAAFFVTLAMRMPIGRRIYIVGNNPVAARLAGIGVDRTQIFCYIVSALLASIGGLVLVGYVDVVDNFVGRGYELDSIVAAVMGGVALSGGKGNVVGGLTGTLILVVLANLVLQIGLPIQFQMILKGSVVIMATGFYSRIRH